MDVGNSLGGISNGVNPDTTKEAELRSAATFIYVTRDRLL
jgi:hypothetical protein